MYDLHCFKKKEKYKNINHIVGTKKMFILSYFLNY